MRLSAGWVGFVSLLALACGSDSSGPTTSVLQNDNFTSGGSPAFQGGFANGEAAAVRLGPQSAAFTIRKVFLLFGGDPATQTVTLTIYQDGDSLNPGTPLFSNDYSLTGSSSAMQEIDLTGEDIHVTANQRIRVAVGFHHVGLPSVAIDAAITSARNLIDANPGGWTLAETALLNGDFIIRAEISTP